MGLFGILGRRGMPIYGDGIYLRPAELRDYDQWSKLREQSRAFLTPWEPVWPSDDLTQQSFRYRVRRHTDEMARDEAYSFLIFRQEDDLLVGGLSFGYVRRSVSQSASLGYWMGAPYAGKGYMKRAVYAACLYGFDKQGLNRIDAACLPANEPSKRLLEGIGFRHEGYARAYLNINGDWRDHLLFGLLSKDLTPPIKDR